MIVSDEAYEVYNFLPGGRKPPYLSALSGGNGVISVHTFSKTLGTGLRLGYLHGSPHMLAPLAELRLTNASVFWEYTVGELMASGTFDTIVGRARTAYSQKLDTLVSALHEHAGDYCDFRKPDGGFFVWLGLKGGLCAKDVQEGMIKKGVMAGLGVAL